MVLTVGDKAPEFVMPDTEKKERSLKDFLGAKTILAFFPGAFTGTCTKELCTFRDSLSEFNRLNAQVVGISVDAPFSNKAFAAANNLQFPLLSDHTRTVSKLYGGVHEDFSGIKGYAASKRAVFVLDKNGIIQYRWVSENPGIEPLYVEINEVLSKI